MGQSHQIHSRGSPGPNVHFSCLASMPKINRNAFALPRKPCSYCPSCQTFCKHHRTCQRGPPRAKASVQTLIQSQLPVNTLICFFKKFSVENRTCSLNQTANNTKSRSGKGLTSGIMQPNMYLKLSDSVTTTEQADQTTHGSSYSNIRLQKKRHKKGSHRIFV